MQHRTDSEQFARLEVAAVTGKLPRDLGTWLVKRIASDFAADERRLERDQLLRPAAGQIQGSTSAKIRGLLREESRLNRRRNRPMISSQDLPGLLSLATQRNGGKIPGERQLRRIIDGF